MVQGIVGKWLCGCHYLSAQRSRCAGLGPPQAKQLHRGGGREGSEAPRSPQGKLEHKIHAGILNFWSQPLKLLQFFRAGHIGTQDPRGSLDLIDGGPGVKQVHSEKIHLSSLIFLFGPPRQKSEFMLLPSS